MSNNHTEDLQTELKNLQQGQAQLMLRVQQNEERTKAAVRQRDSLNSQIEQLATALEQDRELLLGLGGVLRYVQGKLQGQQPTEEPELALVAAPASPTVPRLHKTGAVRRAERRVLHSVPEPTENGAQ